jgi:PEGA domain
MKRLFVILLSLSILAYADGNTFTKVRYNGGSVASKVDPKDWNNTLTITPEDISFETRDKVKVDIAPRSVTTLSYGQEAHRRVGTMVALAILVAPVALFGLFHKTRLHYIGLEYNTPDGKHAGILLQGDKDNYRAILVALQGVTGVPVSVGEKDREFVPVSVKTSVSKQSETETAEAQTAPAQLGTSAESGTGTINITTVPVGADVYADDQFYGNAPATLKLKPGKHRIRVQLSGYADWSREISTDSGSEASLTANLEKTQ